MLGPMADPPASPFVADVLAGQVAFVTGGGTGIGKEIAGCSERTAPASPSRAASARSSSRRRPSSRGEGIEVHVDSCDVRDAAAVAAIVAGIVERYGRLDVVVNNAAGNFPAPMTKISPNGFKAVVDIDLLGTYNVSKAAFDAWLREHGGNIVNISAPFELKGAAMQAHVAAAKAGVDSLTRTCAVEWGPYGIRVNGVAPGSIAATEGMRRFADAVRGGAEPRPTNPLGIMGTGEDIAQMVLFLCSPAARFVSGQVVAVDGAGTVDQLKLDLGREPAG